MAFPGLFGFLTLLCVLNSVLCDSTSLRQVNVLYRHGDRSPVHVIPTDIHQWSSWPDGVGWLSKIGMRQHYELGQYMRTRYLQTGFMNTTFVHEEISIVSSHVRRCIMSSLANLAGMYPPDTQQTWLSGLPWQPIPVHTLFKYTDRLLTMHEHCPEYYSIIHRAHHTPRVDAINAQNQDFLHYISSHAGKHLPRAYSVYSYYDPLTGEKAHGMQWPSWVNESIYNKLADLEGLGLSLDFGGKAARLKGGPLLEDMIKNMNNKISGKIDPQSKMFVYSAHDSTIAALLNALNTFNFRPPTYADCIMVEFHQDPAGKYYVELFHRNSSTVYPMTVPGCTHSCPYDDFIRLTKMNIADDWIRECGLTTGYIGTLLPDQPAFVNKELDDINAVFDPKLCVEILLLNCAQHPGHGDETLCGTDGVTYSNHCAYSQARCEYPTLNITSTGPCAAGPPAPNVFTVDSDAIMNRAFCAQRTKIHCSGFALLCATDGEFYENR